MKRNSRLALALHTLSHMAIEPERLRSSTEIATHSNTNAVVVRRVLGHLRDNGLVTSEKGQSGGWRLAKDPSNITLADVYLALDERLVPANDEYAPNACGVETALYERVSEVLNSVENYLVKQLSSTTICEISGQSK